MIQTVRSKTSKSNEDNYTEAMCNRCKATCLESRVNGVNRTNHDAACSEAVRRAHAAGWVDRWESERKTPRHKTVIVIELLCPECQGKEEP